jgi:hypothetical protein
LIQNEVLQEKKDGVQNFFSGYQWKSQYLLPNLKKADYFLKIENNPP